MRNRVFNQSLRKQAILARLSSTPCIPPCPLFLRHKRKKIVKRDGWLFPHWYSSGVAVQRDWLTTLPYTSTVYPAISLRPSPLLAPYFPSISFYLFLVARTHLNTAIHVQYSHRRELYISIRSFHVFFLSISLPNPFFQSDSLHPSSSNCQFMLLFFFSLSLSLCSSFSSFSVNDWTTVLGNASIRF